MTHTNFVVVEGDQQPGTLERNILDPEETEGKEDINDLWHSEPLVEYAL